MNLYKNGYDVGLFEGSIGVEGELLLTCLIGEEDGGLPD